VSGIPKTTLARLPVYLRVLLEEAIADGILVSSDRLSMLAGLNAATVRRDLAHLGSVGVRGVGYDVRGLVDQISSALGLNQRLSVVIVGAGNIGRALALYGGFGDRGFHVVALLDSDPVKVGQQVGGLVVEPVQHLEAIVRARRPGIAVVAVPLDVAGDTIERLVASGVTAIMSFEPADVRVPAQVTVRTVDLAVELQILTCMNRQSCSELLLERGRERLASAGPPQR
jgi:redox-sensing transcriptional repressor